MLEKSISKIIIFGGSFDPVHKAHVQAAKLAVEQTQNLEKIIFVPTFKSPLKTFQKYAPEADRLNMLNTALKDFPKAEISGYEISLSRAVYSYETLNYFQSKFPRSEIYSLVGSDSLANIHLWKNFRYIIQKYKFLAVKRKGTEYFDCDGYKGNCRFLKGEVDEISSTAVRKLLKDGEKNLLQFLDKEVAEYIFQNNLYK